jgi:cytochrome c2
MYDGRVEDRGDWEKFVKELTDTSLAAARAADDQDFDGLMQAGGDIYEVCTKCHEAYLEKVERKRTGGTLDTPVTAPPGAPAPSSAPTTEKK